MKKKILYSIISIIVSAGIVVGSIFHIQAGNTDQNSYISKENKPIIYGTTAIRVPKGTQVDYKHDARFRVFAKDNEDGDLTQQVKAEVVEQNINSDFVGTYHIKYTVTDSDHNEVTITVPVTIEESGTEVWLQKTMYTLPSVDHLNNLGYTRGNYMDRQIIGIYVEAEGTFKVRKIVGAGKLNVVLQNNNQKYESNIEIADISSADSDEGWVTIQNKNNNYNDETKSYYMSSPVVKTLYKETAPVIYEVKYQANDPKIKVLHYYHQGDGETYQTQFFDEWAKDTNSFAIVDGYSVMALIPYSDHDKILNYDAKSFDSLDAYFTWWDKVMDIYDNMIGISYTPDEPWNQAVKTKFFLKANGSGVGGAYYLNSDNIGVNATYCWPLFQMSWGNLHEVGHGYQGSVGKSGNGMSITEVAVNIFCYYIQEKSGLWEYPEEHWLHLTEKEENWNQLLQEGVPFDGGGMDSESSLYFFVNLLNYFGDDYAEAYKTINQYYRKVYNKDGIQLTTQEAWTLALEEKYNVNILPYLDAWGIEVSEATRDKMMLSDAEAIYPLGFLVSDQELATQLKDEFGNIGRYDLVSTSELKEKNLTGKVTFDIQIDDFTQVEGKYITINNGGITVAKIPVTNKTVSIELPIGLYKVALPKVTGDYKYDNFYMDVKNENNLYPIVYTKITDISYGNDVRIQLTGYYANDAFAMQVKENTFEITYRGTYIHNYYVKDQSLLYSKITITSASGEELYTRSIHGNAMWTNQAYETDTTSVHIGDKVTIYYYGNVNDITFYSTLTNQPLEDYKLNSDNHARTYVITKYGLVPEEMINNPQAIYDAYKSRLDTYMEGATDIDMLNPFTNPKRSSIVSDSLKRLNQEDQQVYRETLKQLTTGEIPILEFQQKNFTFKVGENKTLEYFKSFVTAIDAEDGELEVTLTSNINWTQPGNYTITIVVTDSQGNTVTDCMNITIEKETIQNPPVEEPKEDQPEKPNDSKEDSEESNNDSKEENIPDNSENNTIFETQTNSSNGSQNQTATIPSYHNTSIDSQTVTENTTSEEAVDNVPIEEEKEESTTEKPIQEINVMKSEKKRNPIVPIIIGTFCFGIILLVGIKVTKLR